jgi:polyphenol oxidase
MYIQSALLAQFPQLTAVQSTRHGGVSAAPYHSLNLAHRGPDDAAALAENRQRFCQALGWSPDQLVWSYQVHGVEIWEAATAGGTTGCDAFITAQKGLLLAVSVADCTPILIYDARNEVVAAVHAGWRGTVAGLVGLTLLRMAERHGSRGSDCYAFIGACIDVNNFEVGPEVAEQFASTHKNWDEQRQKFCVDLKRANADQLLDFGVPEGQIEISPFCTVEHNDQFYSYRAENGETGRMLAVIGMKG